MEFRNRSRIIRKVNLDQVSRCLGRKEIKENIPVKVYLHFVVEYNVLSLSSKQNVH